MENVRSEGEICVEDIDELMEYALKIKNYGKTLDLVMWAIVRHCENSVGRRLTRIKWDHITTFRSAEQYSGLGSEYSQTRQVLATIKRQKHEIENLLDTIWTELKNTKIETDDFLFRSLDLVKASARSVEEVHERLKEVKKIKKDF